jgi:signal transduction histidine kinase
MSGTRLYWRLYLPLGISLLVATLLAWLLASRLLADALEARLQGQLDSAAALLAEQGLPFTPDILERIAGLLGIGLVLFDPAGRPALAAGLHGTPTLELLTSRHRTWLARSDAPAALEVRAAGTRYRLALRRLAGRDGRYATVAVVASLADLEAAARRSAWWLAAAAAVGLALLAWIGHRTARGITAPLGELASLAGRLADGEREARVTVRRNDEIGALADAVNRMADRLVDYERELAAGSRQVALGQLAARVAHEVRNPLTALQLQLELLGERLGAEQRETIQGLLTEVRRLDLIVSGHLTAAGTRPLERVPTELNALLQAVCDLMRPQFEHRRIHLETVLQPELPALEIDPDRVRQVVMNLLVNAADALDDGGRVRVTSRGVDDQVEIDVEDDGPGIAPALAERLFEPSVSGKPGGLGVGLALSRELVSGHGGTLVAGRSQVLGGARFRVVLPRSGKRT